MMHVLDNAWKDLRFALRQLANRPGFTVTAITVLALGLGANAAIFSVVNAVLLQALPFPHPEKLMGIFEREVVDNEPYNVVAPASYRDWRREAHSFKQIAATREMSFNLSSKSQAFTPQRIPGSACSANLFKTLEVSPSIGRGFQEKDDQPNSPYVAVISYELWKQRFAGSREVLHRQIRLDENNYSIVGVMPEGFHFPRRDVQVWVTLNRSLTPENLQSYSNHFLYVVGRLRDGYGSNQAQAEIDAFVKHSRQDHPTEIIGQGATVIRLDSYLIHDVRTSLLVLLGAVGCLLLIACVNIANLLLTRAFGRQREVAIRSAIGATRARIIGQLLIESTAVSLAGAVAGLIIAAWGAPFLAAHAPGAEQLPQASGIQVNYTVLLFTVGLAMVTGLFAGLFPAYSVSQTDLVNNLKEGGRSNTAGRSHQGARNLLVAVEVGLSVALLIAAGLLLHSFARIQQVQTGVRAENTITMGVTLPQATYKNPAAVANFAREFIDRVQSLHGINSAGLVSYPPLAGHWSDSVFRIEGHPLPPGQMMDLTYRRADPGYFKAAGIPLLKGRVFTERDNKGYDEKHPNIDPVLISESTAKAFFRNIDPIGQRLHYGTDAGPVRSNSDPNHPDPTMQIIGVVGDVLTDPAAPVESTIYLPLLDGDSNNFYVFAHTSRSPEAMVSSIRAIIHRLDPDLPVHDIRTIKQIAAKSTADRQFSLVLLGLFAGIALLLAAVGLYGVVAYAVSQRTGEIGIRMALGAARTDVSRMVLLQGMKPALAGIGCGLLCAAFVTRALQSMLFGIGAVDPITFLAVPVVLLFVVGLACTIPAYRASRIDPTTALRSE